MSTTAAAGGSKTYTKFSSNGSPISSPDAATGSGEFIKDSQAGGILTTQDQNIIKITRTGGGGGGSHSSSRQLGHHQMNQDLPSLKPELLLNDTGLFTVYCFIKNFIGASGTSAVAIDNKIEQAMDLVKSHLMIAVREEVEVLKEKIAELMDRINQLELENTILKANVSQETLSQLSATMQTAATANSATVPPPVQKPSQNTNTSNGPVS